jgi:hypothetical protein
MLFPYEPEQFLQSIRQIIREEVSNSAKRKPEVPPFETPGMTYKPLYKIADFGKDVKNNSKSRDRILCAFAFFYFTSDLNFIFVFGYNCIEPGKKICIIRWPIIKDS